VENKMSGQHDQNLRNVASRLVASD
jgi:hypothetical protein